MLSRVTRLRPKRVHWAWMRHGAVRLEVRVAYIVPSVILNVPAERVVGVHVRHGDKKTESAIIPVEQYLETAKVGETPASRILTVILRDAS
jgi:hypothetical protein